MSVREVARSRRFGYDELCACTGPDPGETRCPCELKRDNYNAEDDLWFDVMRIFTVGDNLYAVTQDALYEYTNGVDRTKLRWTFPWTQVIDIEGLRAIATGQFGEYAP